MKHKRALKTERKKGKCMDEQLRERIVRHLESQSRFNEMVIQTMQTVEKELHLLKIAVGNLEREAKHGNPA